MPNKLHVSHVKSNVADKVPSASTIVYGEIAVNYNQNSPSLFIKDSNNDIVKFVPLPEITNSDNGKALKVVNGKWTLVESIVTYAGEASTPPQSFGSNGDIYFQIS